MKTTPLLGKEGSGGGCGAAGRPPPPATPPAEEGSYFQSSPPCPLADGRPETMKCHSERSEVSGPAPGRPSQKKAGARFLASLGMTARSKAEWSFSAPQCLCGESISQHVADVKRADTC